MSIITAPKEMTNDIVKQEEGLILPPEIKEKINGLSIVSPEVALSRPLLDVVDDTLKASATDNKNTAKAYRTGIGLFLQFLGAALSDRERREYWQPEWLPLAYPGKEGRKTVWEFRGKAKVLRNVNAAFLDSFIEWRSTEGDKRSTQDQRRAAVGTFLSVAYRDNILTHEQAQNMGLKPYKKKQRRDEQPVGRRLTPPEVRKLREIVLFKAQTEIKATRDRAILDLMLYAGLRRDEVASITTANVKQDGGRWWLVLAGKGRKTRRIKIHDTLFKSLTNWAEAMDLTLENGEKPLFYNLAKGGRVTGKALNSSVIGRIVAEYGHLAGLAPEKGENCLSPHDLRRTFARNAFDNGAPLPVVQAALGHADIKTTMRYIGAMENDDDTAIDYVHY